jgi:putative transposase
MSGPRPQPLKLKRQVRVILEKLCRRRQTAHTTVERSQIILLAARGLSNSDIARQVQLHRGTVQRWRERWQAASERLLLAIEAEVSEAALTQMIINILCDSPRPGTPPTFTVEQAVQIIALACENPQESQRPVSHWTPRELAQEVVKRGIVRRISERSVGRILAEADLKPHRVEYWLNPKPIDPELFFCTSQFNLSVVS